jgi:energy-coupling factor transporter ATP-binding protein EcfA2
MLIVVARSAAAKVGMKRRPRRRSDHLSVGQVTRVTIEHILEIVGVITVEVPTTSTIKSEEALG